MPLLSEGVHRSFLARIREGVKTKVLMLSATPVNNRFFDLRNQLALAYEGKAELLDEKLDTSKSVDDIFRQAQQAFNEWICRPARERTTDNLIKKLDLDFIKLLDGVTIARSRKHIERYCNADEIGKFPDRLKPISLRPRLSELPDAITCNEIYARLSELSLDIYTPSAYIFKSRVSKYLSPLESEPNLTQAGREHGIQRLMRVNLLKRLESSVHSFRLTLTRMLEKINDTVRLIDNFDRLDDAASIEESVPFDVDDEDRNTEYFTDWKNIRIDLHDMDLVSWRESLSKDADVIEGLIDSIKDITPKHDSKLRTLLSLISNKIENPINGANKKILIFAAFADTAEYLFEHVGKFVKNKYALETALVTGTGSGRSTIKKLRGLNDILACFSPVSKNREVLMPKGAPDVDILIATDCISERQNLQDCDCCINFDIHWNPVRIIQRFGRIDRIGSSNSQIQLVNFWPDLTLDEYINLKARVEIKMKLAVMTATGDDNLLSPEEKGDLEYRRNQLERFQHEVIDLEDMSNGVSITDLGLNEFRLDLSDYNKTHGSLEKKPLGLHAVAAANGNPDGVIFILKNRNRNVKPDERNQLHPFCMIYVGADGSIVNDFLEPKKLLDTMRLLCRGKDEPIPELCRAFNAETDDGRKMQSLSKLLNAAINSIVETKNENDINSLFRPGGTTALTSPNVGIDDFELICFPAVR